MTSNENLTGARGEFVDACRAALADNSFRRVVASHKKGGTKLAVCAVQGERNRLLFDEAEPKSSAAPLNEEAALHRLSALGDFTAATLSTADHDLIYSENRKGIARLTRGKATLRGEMPAHNRARNYTLTPDRPWLAPLGIADRSGKVTRKGHAKFRQIASFVEIMERDMAEFAAASGDPVHLLDLGCGKGYLTFAAYDWLRQRCPVEPVAEGVDLKTDVIALCNSIADDLGYEGLTFTSARIDPATPRRLDVLIALHACDTATDDALSLGIRSDARFIFCAPCCQAQIAAQLAKSKPEGPFGAITNFPLMRRRQADLITDTARALLLGAMGYAVKFLEFTPLEHTAKNIMLVGVKDEGVDRAKALAEYRALKREAGFAEHALEENLRGLLPAE